MVKWSETWLLRFHPAKCKIMKVGNNTDDRDYYFNSSEDSVVIARTDKEKDIGVIIDDKLNFREDISTRVNKANQTMGTIRRTYDHLDEENFVLLFKGLVRPHVEYAASVWSPVYKKDIVTVENVQRRATKKIPSLKGLEYNERLQKLGLPTLRYRRIRGEMIEVFKMLNVYDDQVDNILDRPEATASTRGHSFKLNKRHARTNVRLHSFAYRVVNLWNDLPEQVVSSPNINVFKNRLDSYWKDHPLKFDWEASESYRVPKT